jgi:hypothetical protein
MKEFSVLFLILVITFQATGATVLWDSSHSWNEDGYLPNRWFSKLVQNLGSHGFQIADSDKGFLGENMNSYDMAVISENVYSVYTDEEIAAIKNFVNDGGGLLILAEWSPNQYLQSITNAFGVKHAVSDVGSYPHTIYTSNFAASPLFDGIQKICFQGVGELTTNGNLKEVVWCMDYGVKKTLGVAGDFGNGRVVILGDGNIFSSFNGSGEYYDRADNRQFSVNTFQYLVPEPTTILFIGLGGMILRKKRKMNISTVL